MLACYEFALIASFYVIVPPMTKEKLIETIQRILNTDIDLAFLLPLNELPRGKLRGINTKPKSGYAVSCGVLVPKTE